MIGVVVVTHGQLATELVNAAEMIVGDLPQFTAVSIGWHDDVNDAREEIAQAIERVRGDAGVLLLTDMFGGTPSNLGMTFLETDRVEVITGVNLPMLIKLAGLRELVGPARRRPRDARPRPERDLGGVGSAARREERSVARRRPMTSRSRRPSSNQLGHARAGGGASSSTWRRGSSRSVRVARDGARDGRQEHHGHPAAGGGARDRRSRSPPTAPTSSDAVDALAALVESGFGEDACSA